MKLFSLHAFGVVVFACVGLLSTVKSYAETYQIHFVPPANNALQEGFLRFTNPSLDPVDVTLTGYDDLGNEGQNTITFSIPGLGSQQMNSKDIENGNENKGLTGFFGSGVDNWRINAVSTDDIGVSAYLRTTNGFMTKIGDTVPSANGTSHIVPMFNPGSNTNQVSKLRLVNETGLQNTFSIIGIDDSGALGTSTGSITLAANNSIIISSQDIENGTGPLDSGIGDGVGKWQLFITSTQQGRVLSLLEAPGGYISNLSKSGN
jgi:hypothetical protein